MYFSYDDMFNPVEGKEQDLIDLYTEYYGEKYRDKIQSRILGTEFFFLDKNPVDTIQLHYARIIQRLLEEYESRVGFEGADTMSVEDYKHLLLGIVCGDIDTLSTLRLAGIACSIGLNIFDYDSVDSFLSDGGNTQMMVDKISECISIWQRDYEGKIDALRQECEQYTRPYMSEADAQNDISQYYGNKIDTAHLDHMSKYMDISNMNFMQVSRLKQIWYSAISIGRENLNSEYILDTDLQEQFMSLFKALGYCYGDDFDMYTLDESLMNIIYDTKLLDTIYTLNKEKYVSTFMQNSQFLDASDRVGSIDTRSGSYNILASICAYLSSNTLGGFTQTHLTRDGGIKHICVCPLPAGLSDGVFIHELGHAIEGEVLDISPDGKYFVDKSGIDMLRIDISDMDFSFATMLDRVVVQSSADKDKAKTKHKYQILSEVIHDYFSREITSLARSKGLRFGLLQDDKPTAYSAAFDMLEEFIESNKPYLKDAMMSKDPYMLLKLLGQDRLDKLADLVEKNVLIPENKRRVILDDIQDKVGTDNMSSVVHSDCKWSKHTREYVDMYREVYDLLRDYTNTIDTSKKLD